MSTWPVFLCEPVACFSQDGIVALIEPGRLMPMSSPDRIGFSFIVAKRPPLVTALLYATAVFDGRASTCQLVFFLLKQNQ